MHPLVLFEDGVFLLSFGDTQLFCYSMEWSNNGL